MQRVGRMPRTLHHEYQRDDYVANDEDGEIGWCIVSPLMMQLLAAKIAGVGNFHEFAKDRASAASRAFATCATPHCLFPRSDFGRLFHPAKMHTKTDLEKGLPRRAAACRKRLFFSAEF
jgi:hypothetical protein